MNLVLLHKEDLQGDAGEVRLTGRRGRHLLKIRRVEVGSEVRVGQVDGLLGRGHVTAIGPDFVQLEVALGEPPPAPHPATLVLALPRPPVLKRVLITVTSMGVKEVILLAAKAVEKSFWQSHELREDELFQSLLLGLEQSRDTRLPRVSLKRRFRPFVEDELPGLLKVGRGYVAHPQPTQSLPTRGVAGDVLAVGPEAGWSEHELGLLGEAGCARISLGDRPLRVEAAVPALLGRMI